MKKFYEKKKTKKNFQLVQFLKKKKGTTRARAPTKDFFITFYRAWKSFRWNFGGKVFRSHGSVYPNELLYSSSRLEKWKKNENFHFNYFFTQASVPQPLSSSLSIESRKSFICAWSWKMKKFLNMKKLSWQTIVARLCDVAREKRKKKENF